MSGKRKGSHLKGDAQSKSETDERGLESSDVKSSAAQSTVIGETENEGQTLEVSSSFKNNTQNKTSKMFRRISHKCYKYVGQFFNVDLDFIKRDFPDYCYYMDASCCYCMSLYNYKKNKPCIMKCGISICQDCINKIVCKDCESIQENLPINVNNEDLNQNNSLILKAQQLIQDLDCSEIKKINNNVRKRRFYLSDLEIEHQIEVNEFVLNDDIQEVCAECHRFFDKMGSCLSCFKILRLTIESFKNDAKLDKNIGELVVGTRIILEMLEKVDTVFFRSFSKFKISGCYRIMVKLSDVTFPESFMFAENGNVQCFSCSKNKYNRVDFAADFLLIYKDSQIIEKLEKILIIDQLQCFNSGVFFRLDDEKVFGNIPVLLDYSPIGNQIISLCSPDTTPSFVNGSIQVRSDGIVITACLNDDVKYWHNIEELIYELPKKDKVSITRAKDLELTLKIHLEDSDKKEYIIGSVSGLSPIMEFGDYKIKGFGVVSEILKRSI